MVDREYVMVKKAARISKLVMDVGVNSIKSETALETVDVYGL